MIARTAFGELYVRGVKSKSNTIINSHLCNILPGDPAEKLLSDDEIDRSIGVFFQVRRKNSLDLKDHADKLLFHKAIKKPGPLQHDEMYTFVPALAAGGCADIENVKIVNIYERLAMLAELDTPIILPSANELFD